MVCFIFSRRNDTSGNALDTCSVLDVGTTYADIATKRWET